jgi:hypothetical protein
VNKPREYVGAQHAANDIAQMGHVVHVRKRTGNEDVALPILRQSDWSRLALFIQSLKKQIAAKEQVPCHTGPSQSQTRKRIQSKIPLFSPGSWPFFTPQLLHMQFCSREFFSAVFGRQILYVETIYERVGSGKEKKRDGQK